MQSLHTMRDPPMNKKQGSDMLSFARVATTAIFFFVVQQVSAASSHPQDESRIIHTNDEHPVKRLRLRALMDESVSVAPTPQTEIRAPSPSPTSTFTAVPTEQPSQGATVSTEQPSQGATESPTKYPLRKIPRGTWTSWGFLIPFIALGLVMWSARNHTAICCTTEIIHEGDHFPKRTGSADAASIIEMMPMGTNRTSDPGLSNEGPATNLSIKYHTWDEGDSLSTISGYVSMKN